MSNYEVLLEKLNLDPNLQYLQIDYPEIIESMKDMNLSFKHMIAILCAAEKDCLKFTQEIERLQQQRELSLPFESSIGQETDEYKEIVYELEQKLIFIVEKLCENKLVNLQIKNYEQLNYQDALNMLIQFIDEKCINSQADQIINQQIHEQMQKYQKKNYFLQIENMKMLSNMKPNKQSKIKTTHNCSVFKQKFKRILQQLRLLTCELYSIKDFANKQYQLLFQQDLVFDKILTSAQFTQTYSKVLDSIKNQHQYLNMTGFVKQSLLASKQINTTEITLIIDKIKKKFDNQITKTACQVTTNIEEIIKLNIHDQNYINSIVQNLQINFHKCVKINSMMQEFYQQKDNLANQIRLSMEQIIFQLNEENLRLKLLQLSRVLEKKIKKQTSESLESLISIQNK